MIIAFRKHCFTILSSRLWKEITANRPLDAKQSNASGIEENHTGSDVSGEYNDYSFEEWDDNYWRDSVYVDSTEEREWKGD